jgi:hypothetical protein
VKATELLFALEEAIAEYNRTNNVLKFIAVLGERGFRIVPRDYEAEAEAKAADDRYTEAWLQAVAKPDTAAFDPSSCK